MSQNGNSDQSDKPDTSQAKAETDMEKKSSRVRQIWSKAGLDVPTVLLMFKGSLPPTIAIAAYQAPAFANHFGTLGYLVAIVSVLGFSIMPRGKFTQTMILNLFAVCLAAAVNLLALYSAIKARQHTTPAGHPPTGYNSSASAVLAIWLVFQTYLINSLRAARPQFQFPAILYSIFLSVSMTYGTQFPTMTYAISFMKQLLEAFLTGFAFATAVSLFVIPISSRKVVFKEITGYLLSLSALLEAQTDYMQSLEKGQPEGPRPTDNDGHVEENAVFKDQEVDKTEETFTTSREARKLTELLFKVLEVHSKIPGDLTFARREVALGKLGSSHLSSLWKLLPPIMIPITGLTSITDILERRRQRHADHIPKSGDGPTPPQLHDVHELMRLIHKPFGEMAAEIRLAFQHCLITLELTKPSKQKGDEESSGEVVSPGSPGFAASFKRKLDDFYESKKQSLRDWCSSHGIDLPADYFETTSMRPEHLDGLHESRETQQRQLFFVLYIEFLLWRAGMATLDLVIWADGLKHDGVLTKTRLIFPAGKVLRKWALSVFKQEDSTNEDHYTAEVEDGAVESLDLGDSFTRRKDPEHLPPRNTWERIGELIRLIPKGLRSDASAFGFRVSAATMTIGIICFLEASQMFFLRNRLLWAMIMVAVSMTRTTGQSIATFFLRILGTVIAMIGAYIIWYIVDGKTPGVIVFLWLWIFLAYYVVLKVPKLVIVGILSLVTALLIIGYELEVKVLGTKTIESNGQPAYPTYTLAPFRLATVTGGLLVAFIWTIFPFPISETTILRKDLGASLYLLANFYSVVHETVAARIHQKSGDPNVKGTRAYHLDKARAAVFTKLIVLTTALKTNSAFSKFQISLGGRFPREEYDGLIVSVQKLLRYLTLMSYASTTFSTSDPSTSWAKDFRKLLANGNHTSHQVTSFLSLLSASLLHGRPLPPYLELPPHDRYLKRLNAIDHDILSVKHIAEPEYSAFAVIQLCSACIHDDLKQIHQRVKTLMGEIDFSFHAVSTEQRSHETLDSEREKKLDDDDDY